MKVVIVGGGIGGLTAALCCHHFGLLPTVLEQAGEIGEVGAGLQFSPNVMKVFAALGLDERLISVGFLPERSELRFGKSGERIFAFPLGETAVQRWGAPYVHIHRADLIEVLRVALEERVPSAIHLGAKVRAYEQDGDHACAILADDTRIQGHVLIGADGIHSAVRRHMLGPDRPEFTGNIAWRVVVPVERLGKDAPPPSACAWVGRGRHGVTYLLRQGKLANFVGVVERDDWQEESWSAEGSREDALRDFAGWHPTIIKLIEQADSLHRWALHARAPLENWCEGRVTLLGDACHPMLPFMAQGAAMAVEDAWVLAACLSGAETTTGPVANALQSYQHLRLPRASKMQATSADNARIFHKRAPLERLVTYGPMWAAGRAAPQLIPGRFDWIYSHDVTKCEQS